MNQKQSKSEKEKMLVVCQHFWPESFRINDICEYLTDEGYEIDVLCGIPNYPKGQYFEGYKAFGNRKQVHAGINIQRAFEFKRGDNSNLRIFLNFISFPIASLFQIPQLLTKKYDKIFIYQLSPVMMALPGIIIGRIKKVERVMYVLDLWPENLFSVIKVQNRFFKWVLTKMSHWHYKHVDKFIVLSEQMKAKIQSITDLPDEKIIVLPQACEKFYETNIRDKSIEERFGDTFNIVYTGNISPAQSFETVLDAAEILKNENLPKIKWIIVGDGMSFKWLKDEVVKRELSDCFAFEGQKPAIDIPRYTPIADALLGCLVKSSLLEATIPAKVMSYLAAGKPLLLSMDGEVQTLINQTIGCGYASETEDAKALAENIRKLYELSDKERDALGSRAKKYHLEHFERNLILSKLEDFLKN